MISGEVLWDVRPTASTNLRMISGLKRHQISGVGSPRGANHSIAGLLDFNCILRTLQLRAENHCEEYGALFANMPAAGFSTYGEEYLGHMNQTSTMLLFR